MDLNELPVRRTRRRVEPVAEPRPDSLTSLLAR